MLDDRYEVFISYARVDDAGGWVTMLRDAILADHRRFSSEPMRIFLDSHDIRDMDDWRHRILGALRTSSVLLVCLSPGYYKSEYCRWELDEYLRMQATVQLAGEGVAAVYFVEVPGADPAVDRAWREEVERRNVTDLRPWFPDGAEALAEREVATRIGKLGEGLWDRLSRVRRAESVRGNVRRPSPTFVGRHAEMRRLHEQVALAQVGVVTTVHGLGGMGKTELAVAYAHAYRDHYRGGAWSLAADGRTDLLELIADLASVPEFGYQASAAEKVDPQSLGRAVLHHLTRLATDDSPRDAWHGAGRAALLILDNVNRPELLSAGQLAALPTGDMLRVVATTRMGSQSLTARGSLAFVAVDSLDPEAALELIRRHQPARDAAGLRPDFADAAQQSAARRIVSLLGGYTLAVEQVAVFLGINPEVTPAAFLRGLESKGVGRADEVTSDQVRLAMLHEAGLIDAVIESTLETLDDTARRALLLAACLPAA